MIKQKQIKKYEWKKNSFIFLFHSLIDIYSFLFRTYSIYELKIVLILFFLSLSKYNLFLFINKWIIYRLLINYINYYYFIFFSLYWSHSLVNFRLFCNWSSSQLVNSSIIYLAFYIINKNSFQVICHFYIYEKLTLEFQIVNLLLRLEKQFFFLKLSSS